MATRNSSSESVRSRQHPHAEIDQQRDARFLSKQMPGEAAGVFNNDDAHAVADNPLEQRREAWPPFDRILAAHCGVSKFVNDLETGSVGKSADGVPLAAAQEFGSFLRCYRHVLPALARRIHDQGGDDELR